MLTDIAVETSEPLDVLRCTHTHEHPSVCCVPPCRSIHSHDALVNDLYLGFLLTTCYVVMLDRYFWQPRVPLDCFCFLVLAPPPIYVLPPLSPLSTLTSACWVFRHMDLVMLIF